MEQLTLQDHPQVLVIDENTDNGWEGGREKDEKNGMHALLQHYAGALSCQALFSFVFK